MKNIKRKGSYNNNETPVDMYKDGEFIGTFPSQRIAADQLDAVSPSGVWAVLHGVRDTYKGYTFKFHDRAEEQSTTDNAVENE